MSDTHKPSYEELEERVAAIERWVNQTRWLDEPMVVDGAPVTMSDRLPWDAYPLLVLGSLFPLTGLAMIIYLIGQAWTFW